MDGIAKTGLRTDIQALRGLAVLLVLTYHSGLGLAASGYLGVDLFFVISGYLITGIIARGIAAKSFSFARFYTRRVRRLLPAATVVLLATTAGSALLLTSAQYALYLQNLVAAQLFAANISLWAQTGYFAPSAALNPLLHLWSLAIEEQYYFLVPLVLTLVPRRWWLVMLALATVLSLGACLYLSATRPSIAFFWLPPRAWELGLGSIAALIAAKPAVRDVARRLMVLALPAVVIVPFVTLSGPTPGLGAILVCVSTAILILARDERADQSAPLRALARVGDFSYSLYLVHWPIFALARVPRLSGDLPPMLAIALMLLSLALGWLLYRFVEEPFRRSSLSGARLVAVTLAGSVTLLLVAWSLAAIKPDADPTGELLRPIEGLGGADCFRADPDRFDGRCSQSPRPEILLWGDSYAAHLVPGLLATTHRPIAQASKGHCTPLAGVSAVVTANEYDFSRRCLSYNASVIDHVRRTPSIGVVMLSGQYLRFLPANSAYAIRRDGDRIVRTPLGLDALVAAQRDTVAALRALGRRVIIVSPPPPAEFDVGQCWQRAAERLPLVGERRDCTLKQANAERSAQQYDAMISGFERIADVPVIRLDDVLCRGGTCDIAAQGRPIFRDDGHLTASGSILVARRLDLGGRVWSQAR